MAFDIEVPNLGRDMTEALIAEWYRPDGASVEAGEPVACVESDFVAFEVEAERDGIVRHSVAAGEARPAGEGIGAILGPGERMAGMPAAPEPPATADAPAERPPRVVYRRASSLQMAREAAPDWGKRPGADEPLEPPADPDEEALQSRLIRLKQFQSPESFTQGDEQWTASQESVDDAPPQEPRVIRPADVAVPRPATSENGHHPAPTAPIHAVPADPPPLPSTLEMRATVSLDEAQKMCSQLGREWADLAFSPSVDDVVVRAVARALDGDLVPGVDGRIVRLLCQTANGSVPAELKEAGTRLFRETVAGRAAGAAITPSPGITVTSYAATAIDEAKPRLERNEPLGVTLGSVRRQGDSSVAVVTLGYAEETVSDSAAAMLLLRIRELIEAPYALLAE